MTNSAFQFVDDLGPWTITDFEILMNNQNTIVATNPGQFYYHQRGTNSFPGTTSWEFKLSWPDKFSPQMLGGMPIHAYVQLAGQTNVWTDWTPQSTGICWNAAQNQCSGEDGTITVNNIPTGATVWVTVHLDYNLKGTTQLSDFTKKPIYYGPFQSDVLIKAQVGSNSSTWPAVGTSTSNTSLIGRGKKVTVVYGKATDASGNVLGDTWIQLKQGSNTAMTKTDSNGDYLFFDGQACSTTDGIQGTCTGTWGTTITFGNGTTSTTLTFFGRGASPTATPAFPDAWTKAEVRNGNTVNPLTTVTVPYYTFGVGKGSANSRNLKFRN
jgi:hypothetical protein